MVEFPIRLKAVVMVLGLSMLTLTTVGGTTVEAAEAPIHPVIPGFERFHAVQPENAEGGRLLLGELNCTSCHQASDAFKSRVLARKAPVLSQVGSRVTIDYLRKFLANPHEVKPGTPMPALFTGLSTDEKKTQVEAIVHFLATTGTVHQVPPSAASARNGEALFHRVGCVACHQPQTKNIERLPTSVPLGELSKKYSIPSLSKFLEKPHLVRPSGRMPNLNLSNEEARDIATYLLQDIDVEPNLRFKYYEGNWPNVPEFTTIKPIDRGGVAGFDLNIARRKNNFGLRFEGYLHIQTDGEYTFHIGSDDGSKLMIDGKRIAGADGVHPFTWSTGKVMLKKGTYPVIVDYTQGGGEWVLKVEYEGPNVKRQDLAGAVSASAEPRSSEPGFEINPALVDQGRKLFSSVGCANCHELQENGKPLLAQLSTKPLLELSSGKGCVVSAPGKGIPDFHLSAAQRTALDTVLKAKPPAEETVTSTQVIHRTMTTFNCYACHTRDKKGGVERARDELFTGTIPEMGDEGRIPPHLDGVGDKLKASWLKEVMDQGAKDRPYMHTRMPRFGSENVGNLLKAFAADAKTESPRPEFNISRRKVKDQARFMIGDQALSCIKCHTFGKYQAIGLQSLDLTVMTRRLREDWFRRYMINPQVFRPGTRMPTAFPNGESILPDVLNGHPQQQITAMWDYLDDGTRARIPKGIITGGMELVPIEEPIIYRNFIEKVSPRGIGVGNPEGYHFAFDADRMNLALIWQGAFIDAKRHWSGRGQGFEPPAGDAVMELTKEAPFAVLPEAGSEWPKQPARELGYKFKGYTLDKQRRPHFLYSWNDASINDFPHPFEDDKGSYLKRTLTITKPDKSIDHIWFRAAVGKIEKGENGWYIINSDLKTQLQDETGKPLEAVLRTSGNQQELLVSIPKAGTTVVHQLLSWE